MARRNPEVERLEKENQFLRNVIEKLRKEPPDNPILACDNSCVCATAVGMHTNGGCRCDERKLRRAVQWWRRRCEFLQCTLIVLRDGDPVAQHDDLTAYLAVPLSERLQGEPASPYNPVMEGYTRRMDPITGEFLWSPKDPV